MRERLDLAEKDIEEEFKLDKKMQDSKYKQL